MRAGGTVVSCPEIHAAVSSSASTLHRVGNASFRFERSPDGVTYIARQEVAYPFHVTRPFYLEGDPQGMPTLYLQSVSGGLFDQDVVSLNLQAEPDTFAHITTQSSTIVHEAKISGSIQQISIAAKENTLIEYLPDPQVMFPGARLASQVNIVAAPSATVVVYDSFLAHDPNGVGGLFDQLASELVVETPEGRLRCLDRFEITGEQLRSDRRFTAHGTFVCVDEDLAEEARVKISQSLSEIPGLYTGVSTLPDDAGLWARLLAPDTRALRHGLSTAWRQLRQIKTGLVPHLRRK